MGQMGDERPSQSEESASWGWQFELLPIVVPARTPGQAAGGGEIPATSPGFCENLHLQARLLSGAAAPSQAAPPGFTCALVLHAEASERNGLQTFLIRHLFSKNTLRGPL